MQLQPTAFIYLALRRLGGSLISVLMVVAFAAGGLSGLGHHALTIADYRSLPVLIVMAAWVAVSSLLAVLLYFWIFARTFRIALRTEGVSLQYGIINTTNELLPYGKIQDVVISRSLLERLMSLGTVTIQNGMGKPQIIPGLSADDAELLRDRALAHLRNA